MHQVVTLYDHIADVKACDNVVVGMKYDMDFMT
jgi:hypothetical protein